MLILLELVVLKILLIAFVVTFFARLFVGRHPELPDGALALLQRRFAQGEIDETEFRRARDILSEER